VAEDGRPEPAPAAPPDEEERVNAVR
jgi:hypothetical protein